MCNKFVIIYIVLKTLVWWIEFSFWIWWFSVRFCDWRKYQFIAFRVWLLRVFGPFSQIMFSLCRWGAFHLVNSALVFWLRTYFVPSFSSSLMSFFCLTLLKSWNTSQNKEVKHYPDDNDNHVAKYLWLSLESTNRFVCKKYVGVCSELNHQLCQWNWIVAIVGK